MISRCATEAAGNEMPHGAVSAVRELQGLTEQQLESFFVSAIDQGEVPRSTDPKSMALFVTTVLNGTAALARTGKAAEEILDIMDPVVRTILQK